MSENKRSDMHFKKKGSGWLVLIITLIVVIVLVGVLIFLLGNGEEKEPYVPVCGDENCSKLENCYACPEDCKCGDLEYCSAEKTKCIKIVCGNGDCEPFESPENCCLDCPCTIPGKICNETTKTCYMPVFALNDTEVEDLVKGYVEEQGKGIESLTITETSQYNDELVKLVRVMISSEGWLRTFAVNENKDVFELPTP